MKKKYFFSAFIVALVSVVYVKESMNSCTYLTDLGLENVEALASDGEATKVGYCYLEQTFSSVSGRKSFCDSRTNDSQIYPCLSSESYGGYSESAKDRCTK